MKRYETGWIVSYPSGGGMFWGALDPRRAAAPSEDLLRAACVEALKCGCAVRVEGLEPGSEISQVDAAVWLRDHPRQP